MTELINRASASLPVCSVLRADPSGVEIELVLSELIDFETFECDAIAIECCDDEQQKLG